MPLGIKMRGGLSLGRPLGLEEMGRKCYDGVVDRMYRGLSDLCEEIRVELLAVAENEGRGDLSDDMRADIVELAGRIYVSGIENVSGGDRVVHIGFRNDESLHLKIPYRDVMRMLEYGSMESGRYPVWRPSLRKFLREVVPSV